MCPEDLPPTKPKATPFGEHLGLELLQSGDGRATVQLALAPHLCNRRGVAHGGAVASLLDSALGAAVISTMRPEEWCGTLQLSIQFNEPARSGPLVAEGQMVRRGRSVAFAEGTVSDANGRVVARAHGTWTIWPRHPDGAPDASRPASVLSPT